MTEGSWYADTSALMKLVRAEAHSTAMGRWIRRRSLVTSVLTEIELARAAARALGPVGLDRADVVLRDVDTTPLRREIVEDARRIEPVLLRSLDAVHLASAMALEDHLAGIVAYDERLLEAAKGYGIKTASPS